MSAVSGRSEVPADIEDPPEAGFETSNQARLHRSICLKHERRDSWQTFLITPETIIIDCADGAMLLNSTTQQAVHFMDGLVGNRYQIIKSKNNGKEMVFDTVTRSSVGWVAAYFLRALMTSNPTTPPMAQAAIMTAAPTTPTEACYFEIQNLLSKHIQHHQLSHAN